MSMSARAIRNVKISKKITIAIVLIMIATVLYPFASNINSVAAAGSSWTTVVSAKTGSGVVTDTFSQVAARYVRITVTGNTANTAAHIEEFKVYQSTSQIHAVTATASSYNGAGREPLNAIDGIESNSNYWGTAAVLGLPQWLIVDLGFVASINQVVTHFYDGNTRSYTYNIDVSADGSSSVDTSGLFLGLLVLRLWIGSSGRFFLLVVVLSVLAGCG